MMYNTAMILQFLTDIAFSFLNCFINDMTEIYMSSERLTKGLRRPPYSEVKA